MSSNVFKSAKIGGIKVKNRIFRSATHEALAEDGGKVSQAMKDMYQDLANGGTGLIISGYMGFSESDNLHSSTVNIGSDEAIESLSDLARVVHSAGSRVVAQISHVGSQLAYPPSQEVLAPSDVIDPSNGIQPKPFSKEQIPILVNEFAQAALRIKKSGFDGVQIHGAHGYLLSKFLSPVYNKRTDEYGGSPENNARIIIEIIDTIKQACGKDFPVWIKLNSSDFGLEDDAYDYDDFLKTAEAVTKTGLDAIEISGGTMTGKHSPARPKSHQAYHLEYAKQISGRLNISIISVGGFRTLETVEQALADKNIDAVSMCRPLIREPNLVNRWMEGDRSDAACVACNGCFNPSGTKCFFSLHGEERDAQKKFIKMMNARSGNNA